LLVQFVHAALTLLGSGLEHRGHNIPEGSGLLRSQQQQRQSHRCRMRRDARSRLQFGRHNATEFALHPKRTHAGARLIFQSAGKVDDGAARIARTFPVLARAFRIGGKESEIDVFKLLGPHALNKADFVAHGFELAQRFVVIEQAHVHCRKVARVEHLGNFFALERGGADDRDTI
jgi:hypothetical protein